MLGQVAIRNAIDARCAGTNDAVQVDISTRELGRRPFRDVYLIDSPPFVLGVVKSSFPLPVALDRAIAPWSGVRAL